MQSTPPQIPNPENLKPAGLSDRQKRWIFFGVAGVILFIILANIVGSNTPVPAKATDRTMKAQQQNPTPVQIREWENNLKQTEAQLRDEINRQQQAEQTRGSFAMTSDDLQRAAALHDAAQARQQFQQSYGASGPEAAPGDSQKAQLQAEREQQAYKSLFADNLVRQERVEAAGLQQSATAAQSKVAELQPAQPNVTPAVSPSVAVEKPRKALDFDPAKQDAFWLPEGTIVEAVLTNRLDGEQPGPVNGMVTTDVYLPGTKLLLIPQGARVLGEASKVSTFGQQRLAVAFHRIE
jgi:type IV secretion system protein VirB10